MLIRNATNFFKKYPFIWKALIGIFFVYIIYYFAFQYARATSFPIGDDPAAHITSIKNNNFAQLWSSNYPVPLIIFKWFSTIFCKVGLPKLFTLTISFYFFMASVAVMFLAKSVSKSWLVGFLAALIFVNGRWVNDGIRMGLLAETWGWFVFAVLLYFFTKRNLILTFLFSAILVVSHPLSFITYSLFFITILLMVLIDSKDQDTKKFLLILTGGYIIGIALAYFFKNDLIHKFLFFISGDPKGYGQRPFWLILTSDEPQRIFIPIFAIIGLAASLKNWFKLENKTVVALVITGLFMSLNYIFGIFFLSFRFYPYFEISLSILAAIGVFSLVELVILPAILRYFLLAVLAFFVIYPSNHTNNILLNWQKNDPGAQAIMMPYDQKALLWIKDNIPDSKTIAVYWRYGIWISALDEKHNLVYDNTLFDHNTLTQYLAAGNVVSYDYIYLPLGVTSTSADFKDYKIVYADQVLILKKNDPPPPTTKKRRK